MEAQKHHQQQPHCFNRPRYREGNRPRAVKVYTIAQESRYLLVQGVPAVGAAHELVQLFALYGAVQEYHAMDEYPAEPFTDVYLIKYGDVHSARVAKRRLDERSFFGGVLHVCYAPEFESVEEARSKLQARRRYVERVARMPAPRLPGDKPDDKPASRSPPRPEPKRARAEPLRGDARTGDRPAPSYPTWPFPAIPPPPRHLPPSERAPPPPRSQDAERYPEPGVDRRDPRNPAASAEGRTPHGGSRREREAAPRFAPRFAPRTALLEARSRRRSEGGAGGPPAASRDADGPLVGPTLPPDDPEEEVDDLGDASLNASARLIRDRIRRVTDAASSNVSPEQQRLVTQAKARRRI